MSLSLQSLRVFLAVVEEGSFSGAGRVLGMTQPAVSNHLHALEENFGVELLSRARPIRATPAGEALILRARNILGEVAALEEEMARHVAPRGSLVVGSSSTPAEFFMPGVAAEFSAVYPEVSLELRVYDSERALRALLDREVEVSVVGYEVEDSRIETRVVEEEKLVLVVASDEEARSSGETSKETVEGLSKRPFVLRERGSATRLAAERGLSAVGVEPRVVMELGSNGAIAGAVAEGVGVGVVPERFVTKHPGLRKLPVEGLDFKRPFSLVTQRNRRLSPAALAFVETCAGKNRKARA